MKCLLLVITFLVILIDQTYCFRGVCPTPKYWSKTAIDSSKLGGLWYNVVRTDFDTNGGKFHRCIRNRVFPSLRTGVSSTSYWIEIGLRSSFGTYELYNELWPITVSNELGVSQVYEIKDGNPTGQIVGTSWRLAIDYDKYLVDYTCYEDQFSGTFRGDLVITARGPFICDDDWNVIIDAINRADIIKAISYKVRMVDHNNCPRKELQNLEGKVLRQLYNENNKSNLRSKQH